ncbi:hypothetical protein [Sphingobacterium sp.]|uniref:hypothetical protein n=1 Tax=Sphingobacterium sp. TaxID=341027 RepID=UPI0028B12C9D|nr:hypothetical protein [Sphingobacterium sp.]
MLHVTIDEQLLTDIIDRAVDTAIKKEREKNSDPVILNLTKMSEMFGVTRQTVISWVNTGQITSIPIGGSHFFDLNKVIKEKETKRKR